MEDIVVVTKIDKGKIKLHQAVNLTAAGAVGGSFWGMLIGFLFLNPLLGAAVRAGAISGKLRDIGISKDFMKELAENLTEGTSALFILIREATSDKVLDRLQQKGFKGKVLQTSLAVDKEDELRKVLGG